MRDRETPITQTIKASEARTQWSQLINDVFRGNRRILVEKSGIPVAAIISARDLTRFQQLEADREAAFRVIDETRAAFKDVPDEELEREVNRAVAAARAKRRAARNRPIAKAP